VEFEVYDVATGMIEGTAGFQVEEFLEFAVAAGCGETEFGAGALAEERAWFGGVVGCRLWGLAGGNLDE
jgi:hypothetical protein